ncbi:MAG TPA: peptidyl-tRNA hydrolase [Candidatus Dietzia intestinipullorum]|nr:peptidyl-tRNA hydrolase [Candidatus Dietzia intestinipullorum]
MTTPATLATGAALDWCHARLAAGSAGAEDPSDRATVRAMPLVLHLPKADRPARTPLLEAVAGAVATLCLDERVAPGGDWHEPYADWMDARMRKIARRARGAQWRAALEVDGVSRQVDGAVAGAFVPGPVDEVDPRLGRLQIGGTDLERDEPGPPPTSAPVVWIDGGLGMSVGKAAAQVGHGVMLLAAAMPRPRLDEWIAQGLPVSVREAAPEHWCRLTGELAAGRPGVTGVVDAGYTEVAPGSVTVIAVDPAR